MRIRVLLTALVFLATAAPVRAFTSTELAALATKTGSFLLSAQDTAPGSATEGSLFPATPRPSLSDDNITGIVASGLLAAYRATGNQAFLNGAELAGDYLAARTGGFATFDAPFLVELSAITGKVKYRNVVKTYYLDALLNGTYVRRGATYDTASYLSLIQSGRTGEFANLRAWDISRLALASARMDHPIKDALRIALESSMDSIYPGVETFTAGTTNVDPNATRYYDAVAAAAGIQALADMGDPDAYRSRGLNGFYAGESLAQMAASLGALSITTIPGRNGAFPYLTTTRYPVTPDTEIDDVQTTDYVVGALSMFGSTYAPTIDAAFTYLQQQVTSTGEILAYDGASPTSGTANAWIGVEITAEALIGLTMIALTEVTPAAGGVASSASGAEAVVQPGAVSTPTDVTIAPAAPPGPVPANIVAAGEAFTFGPPGATFAKPVIITLPFDPSALARLNLTTTSLVVLKVEGNGATSILVPVSIDPVLNLLTVDVTSFSTLEAAANTAPPPSFAGASLGGGGCSAGGAADPTLAYAVLAGGIAGLARALRRRRRLRMGNAIAPAPTRR